jgi:hypothetical protein
VKFFKKIERDNLNLSIQLMDTLNQVEINDFLKSYYKSFGVRSSLNFNWFHWFYNENPIGKCQNYILKNEQDNIVGGFGYSLFNYFSKGIKKVGVIGVNGFINPDYTGLGLYTQLITESLKDILKSHELAFSLPHSENIASIKGHLNSGWKLVKKLDFYVKYINLKDNIPSNKNINVIDIPALRNFDFNYSRGSYLIKSYDWLNWRFNRRPNKQYNTLVYTLSDTIKGYVIYTLYIDKDGNTRCQVADYEYIEKTIFVQLLENLCFIGSENNYQTIEFLVNEEYSDTKILKDLSFIKKNESYHMFGNGNLTKFENNRNFKFEYGYFDVV